MIFKNLNNYKKNLVSAIDINQTHTRFMHNTGIKQSLPIAIDVYSNALLRKVTNTNQYSIEITSHPVPSESPNFANVMVSFSCTYIGSILV